MTLRPWLFVLAFGSALPFATGCSQQESDAASDQDIIGGIPATEYVEAATIDYEKDGQGFICSGAVIAPRVVLTAGHCVVGGANWFVRAGGVTASASTATVFDYTDRSNQLDLSKHDIGLLFLDDPITLTRYPSIARAPLRSGARVLNVGRILNGTQTNSLFGRETNIQDGIFNGGPFDYTSSLVIQPGDSGGPDFAVGTHMIVSVNSAEQHPTEIQFLARVDLLHDWIQQQIAAHGGGGASNGGGGGVIAPTEGAIPQSTLRSVDRYEVVSQQLNCRAGAGTTAAVEQKFFQGDRVQATQISFRPRVAIAPDGNPWLLVQGPSGGACYVSANLKFIAPREGGSPPPSGEAIVVNPGLYGSLALAVHGNVVTGSVREGSCELTIAGQIPGSNPINLQLFSAGGNGSAQLNIIDDTTVSFSTSDLPGGCTNLFERSEMAGGIEMALRTNISTAVFAFRTIRAAKAFFHNAPGGPARPGFVISGQTVQQLGENISGFVNVRFTSPQGATTAGFLASSDLVSLGFNTAGL